MQSTTDQKALEILSKWDRILYIDMTQALKRGLGKAFYTTEDGVLVYAKGVWMIAAQTPEAAREIEEILKREWREGDELCAHGRACLRFFEDPDVFFWYSHPCYVCAYFAGAQFDVPQELEIRKLDKSHAELVSRTYTMIKGTENALEYAQGMIEDGMFGGFLDDECVGYIGLHPEGSMGMLEVFPEYRNCGFGTALEMFLVNRLVSGGMVPFGHVWDNNAVSLQLQKSLGFRTADDMVFWGNLLTKRK